MKDRLLTTKEVGERLGFKPRTVSRWCREGRYPGAIKFGRVWRIPTSEASNTGVVRGSH